MAVRVVGALILTASIVVAACGGSSPESKSAALASPAAAPAADHSGHGKVFFKEPANGAMVKSPVHLVFGSDMFTIAPVPEGEVTTVRENTGDYISASILIVCPPARRFRKPTRGSISVRATTTSTCS